MKLVLDTNVVLDWLVFRDASLAGLQSPLDTGRIELIAHAPAIDELRRVLTYAHLKLAPDRQQQILEQYLAQTRPGALPEGFALDDLKLPATFPHCRDCDDQHFLALAYHERADALVSKDRAVLKLRKRARKFGVTILDPRQLASMLNGSDTAHPMNTSGSLIPICLGPLARTSSIKDSRMKFLANMFGKKTGTPAVRQAEPAPLEIRCEGTSQPFALQEHLYSHEGLPILDWQAALDWSSQMPNAVSALIDCKRGWLLHLRDALGQGYELREAAHAAVLSTGDERFAAAMLDFIERTRRRITVTLEGLATFRDDDREILIIFDDPETYYRYVSHAYPEDGEFAFSSGMFLHAGCPHFVTMQDEHHTVERVITHEMTHASVDHLPIPLWLNEGLAVNTEDRLTGKLPKLFDPAEMRRKHLAFWSRDTIQEFWSGHSFGRPDDGCMLSYDLAQILVEILAGQWPQFRAFASAASYQDAGASAASEHMGIDLGDSLAAIFEQSSADGWRPDPEKWHGDVAHTPE